MVQACRAGASRMRSTTSSAFVFLLSGDATACIGGVEADRGRSARTPRYVQQAARAPTSPIGLLCSFASRDDGKNPEAGEKDHQPGHVPAKVFSEAVVNDSEPGQHLPEEPAGQAVGDAHLRASASCKPTIPKTHVQHLNQRVEPGQYTDAPQLEEKVGGSDRRRSETMEDPHDEAKKESDTEQHSAYVRQALGREPVVPALDLLRRGAETNDGWNHAEDSGLRTADAACEIADYRAVIRGAESAVLTNTAFPAIYVASTWVPRISSGGTVMMSRSRTTKSAYLPTEREPVTLS